jgi:hypothetical protein
MALAAAEFVGNAGELQHLFGGEKAAGDFAANHLDARLPLAVDAVFEAERAEIVFSDFAGKERGGFGTKGLDLLADRNLVLFFKRFALVKPGFEKGGHNHLISDAD